MLGSAALGQVAIGQGSAASGGTTSYTLSASAGSFALTGQAATLTSVKTLTAAAGAYTLTGQSATLKRAYTLTSAVGSFTLAGQDASLKRALSLSASVGAYTLSGQDAALKRVCILSASPGAIAINGGAVVDDDGSLLGFGSVGGGPLAGAGSGAVSSSAGKARLLYFRLFHVAVGSVTVIGYGAALVYSETASASAEWLVRARRRGGR